MRILRHLFVAFALLFAASAASADPLNALYLVIADGGSFDNPGNDEYGYETYLGVGDPTYTVVWFMNFGPAPSFPLGVPGTIFPRSSHAGNGGKEFFFIGTLQDGGENQHFAIGDAFEDSLAPGPIPDAFDQALQRGVINFPDAFEFDGPGASATVYAADFWAAFVDGESEFDINDFASIANNDFLEEFGGAGSLGWRIYSTLNAVGGGSENVFGFTEANELGVAGINENGGGTWDPKPVPEPGTLLLAGGAAVAAMLRRRRRKLAA